MHSHIQGLRNQRPTARASLGRVSRFNQHDHTTSILSFVRGVLDQLTPGGIRRSSKAIKPKVFNSF